MSASRQFRRRHAAKILVVGLGISSIWSPVPGQSESCAVSSEHGGLTFPIERVDPIWTCRLHTIIKSATTQSTVGPIRAALPEPMYRYLLNHPPLAAALIRRLKLGLYQSESRGPDRFWGDDGEGTKGIVELVYQDPTNRIYFLEGTHESRLLPHVRGKAVVLLRTEVVNSTEGMEAMDSTLVVYTKLDNPVLSGLVSLLHPLVVRVVKSRLQKGVETVNQLGLAMRRDPQRVLSEAMSPPGLPDGDVRFLNKALSSQPRIDKPLSNDQSIP